MKNPATPARIIAAAFVVAALATHSRACPDGVTLSACHASASNLSSSQFSTAIATIEKVEESAQTLAQAAHGAGMTLALANGAVPIHANACDPQSARFEQSAITLVASLTKAVFVCFFADPMEAVTGGDPAIEPSEPELIVHDVCVTV